MPPKLDLDAYFNRIGYAGPAAPTLETLTALHALHPQAISFDGLSPFLGEPVSLEIDALQAKLLGGARGGYCFEHNVLFWKVLQAIGFRVSGVAGRVRLNWPASFVTPRGHMALLVSLPGGSYLADVGFGGLTLTAPVRMELGLEQATPHEPVRIVETTGGVYAMQSKVGSEWRTLYSFDLQETFMADYEMFNWFYATHPESPFVRGVIAARPVAGKRLALRNTRYLIHVTDQGTQTRVLASVADLRNVIEEDFGIVLSWNPVLDAKLQAMIDAEATPKAT